MGAVSGYGGGSFVEVGEGARHAKRQWLATVVAFYATGLEFIRSQLFEQYFIEMVPTLLDALEAGS